MSTQIKNITVTTPVDSKFIEIPETVTVLETLEEIVVDTVLVVPATEDATEDVIVASIFDPRIFPILSFKFFVYISFSVPSGFDMRI